MIKSYFYVAVFVLLLISEIAKTQPDYRKGYVITNSNDTVYGMIDFQGYVRNSVSCNFISNKSDSAISFYPQDIQAYRFLNDKYYVSKLVPTKEGSKYLFLEYIIKGLASIYYYRDKYGEHYLISKQGDGLNEIRYYEDEIVKNDVRYLRQSTVHIGLLETYMKDCPEIYKEIRSIKIPDRENLISLAEDYHHMVCKNDSCIVYEKKKIPVRVDIEPMANLIIYNGYNAICSETGLLLHFWLPLSSEKLYFKTGYIYSRPPLKSGEEVKRDAISKFPLALEYIVPGKVIRPTLSVGMNFYLIPHSEIYYQPAFGVGLLMKVYNKMYFSVNLNSEWTPIIPHLLITHSNIGWASCSIDAGIRFRL